jgi:hypothetical protein
MPRSLEPVRQSRRLRPSRPHRRSGQPSYRLHKARNCAVVTINGKNHYLGPYDSPESHEEYARLIAEWRANGKAVAAIASPPVVEELTLNPNYSRTRESLGLLEHLSC